jgi:hypothetical protein
MNTDKHIAAPFAAPKAQNMIAQGNALGCESQMLNKP